jgi:hypothetical protein
MEALRLDGTQTRSGFSQTMKIDIFVEENEFFKSPLVVASSAILRYG